MREAFRRAGNAWDAIRRAQTSPARESADTPDAAPEEGDLVGLGDSAAAEEHVVSVREHVFQVYRDRLVTLHREYGQAPDVDALLRELAAVHPGVIHQPMGVAQQVMDMLNRENYSGAQIARVIETDPAIAQALLKHANSDWYEEDGTPPVSSLLLATRRVGARGVHAAVTSVIVEGGCTRPGAGLDEIARMVWDHMVRVAPISRQLAYGFGGDPDAGFTLGLCHDVGKLILFERIAEVRRNQRKELTLPRGFLRAALRSLHEPLGGLAAFAWGMPPDFAATIASHHRLEPKSEPDPLSEALFVAERLDLMVSADRDLDLKRLWADGAISIPLETGARLFEQARQSAVVWVLQARRAGGNATAA